MNEGPIGIFDSGVGGLTVQAEIEKILPNENYIYLGDTKNFPYGPKGKEEIIKLAIKNTKILVDKGCKIVVVACGTATSQALEKLKEIFDIPILGIIEPTVKYVHNKKIKKVGVIATKGTIISRAWEKLLKQEYNIQVVSQACPMLAEIAEEGRAKSKEGRYAIKEYMKPLKEEKVEHIILGCTHYPIYNKLIKEEFEYPIELIHTGKTVAIEVQNILKERKKENKGQTKKEIYLTKPSKEFQKIVRNIFNITNEVKNI